MIFKSEISFDNRFAFFCLALRNPGSFFICIVAIAALISGNLRFNPNILVHGFEPLPSANKYFKINVELNKLSNEAFGSNSIVFSPPMQGNMNYVSGGYGGAGTANSISGVSVTYAGGGGGGCESPGTPGTGGAGGGGNGGQGTPQNGTANTGGGAGGSGNAQGSTGGSGIVIVRYLGAQKATGGTVTSAGGYTIHTFTASGTFLLT